MVGARSVIAFIAGTVVAVGASVAGCSHRGAAVDPIPRFIGLATDEGGGKSNLIVPPFPPGLPASLPALPSPSRRAPSFEHAPDFGPDIDPGRISVIFRDSFRIRVAPGSRSVYSNDPVASAALNTVFGEHGLKWAYDISGGQNDETVDRRERNAEGYWGADIPSLKSTVSLVFPEHADTRAIAVKLRALPWVRAAYPEARAVPLVSLVSKQDFDNLGSAPPPTDVDFSLAENPNWYFFNRHRIFEAWEVYGASESMVPHGISVIDNGFDVDAAALDRPNYIGNCSYSIDASGSFYGPGVQASSCDTFSHGAAVATLLAAPRNNGSGIAGVAPGAPICPFKVQYQCQSIRAADIALGINWASTMAGTPVVNVSLGIGGKPITWSSVVRTAITTVVGEGTTVIIGAANSHIDLDNTENIPPDDPSAGAIVVGGTQLDGKNWTGSNYGTIVDLAASAADIRIYRYNPSCVNDRFFVNGGAGTSFAAPMVAGVAAMALSLRERLYGKLPMTNERAAYLKQLLWGSATIAKSSNGEQLGKYLEQPGRSAGNANIRDLNAANALHLATLNSGMPVARIHNVDNETWWAKNADWNNLYPKVWYAEDTIWSTAGESYTASDDIAFSTWNSGGPHTHGYQIWRNGYLAHEHLGGSVERRAPWGVLYSPSFGEDGGDETVGWHHTYGWPALGGP